MQAVRDYLVNLQQAIVSRFEALDGNAFITDEWKRADADGPAGACMREQPPHDPAWPTSDRHRAQYAPRRARTAGNVLVRIEMSSQIDQFSR